ncbi:MAG: TatD family hydrolase [Candidatus Woesebacteria bacterium]|jgi:TatD DNase family protein
MEIVDTHCHIHSADYKLPIVEVEQRADKAAVTTRFCVGTDVNDSILAVNFAQNRPNTWAAVGIHPHEAKGGQKEFDKLQKLLDDQLKNGKIVAIGECGLDYYYGHSTKQQQFEALRFQIKLALRHDLPIIFHVRDAFDDFWPIFDEFKGIKGVLHCFTDDQSNLNKALERNLYIGINGILTFTKNNWQIDLFKGVAWDRILLETDAPYLTPAPYRGKVNEPAYVRQVAEFLAELRSESLDRVAKTTSKNARELFLNKR